MSALAKRESFEAWFAATGEVINQYNASGMHVPVTYAEFKNPPLPTNTEGWVEVPLSKNVAPAETVAKLAEIAIEPVKHPDIDHDIEIALKEAGLV